MKKKKANVPWRDVIIHIQIKESNRTSDKVEIAKELFDKCFYK